MKLVYPGKVSEREVLEQTQPAALQVVSGNEAAANRLILSENLQAMKTLLRDASVAGKVDLVYIDPPFSTNCVYRHNGDRTATVSSSQSDDVAYADKLKGDGFIEFIRQRLILIRELMSGNGSIYLHIDCKIGHYIKAIMDEVFGSNNFRSDITRIKCNPKNFDRHGYSNIKDMILFYTKSGNFIWNEPREDFTDSDLQRLFPKIDAQGRCYTTTPLHAPGETKNGNTGTMWRGLLPPRGRHWRYNTEVLDELDKEGLIEWSRAGNPRKIIYADEAAAKGKRLQDIWEFKDEQYPPYPTAKNPALLERIVQISSNPNSIVLDCFCGSGTTLLAAARFNRRWIGIDQSQIAIDITIKRLQQAADDLFESQLDFAFYKQAGIATDEGHSGVDASTVIRERTRGYRRIRKPIRSTIANRKPGGEG